MWGMRRAALLLCLVTACSTYRGSARTAKVGAAVAGGSLLLGGLMAESETLTIESALLLALVGGVAFDAMLGGLVGMLIFDEPEEEPRPALAPGRTLAKRTRVRGMSPEEHARCMEDRRGRLIAAQQIQDRKRRGEAISKINTCGDVEEIEVEVSAETGETAEEALARRENAWAMTKRAGAAARAGDCATVLTIGRQVYASDPEFHDTVFARDVAIARCVWPEPATSAP